MQTPASNSDQIEFWNGLAGERWAQFQGQIDAGMEAITAALLPFADAKSGERVLDIGCGFGTTTLRLAEAVAPSGFVTGVDISKPMLALAARRAKEAGTDVRVFEDDAATRAFAPDYDLIVSRFGVMFFAAPIAAFANIRKALKRTGRLAFVCWRAPAENLWATVPLQIAKPHLPAMTPPDPLAPGPFAFADSTRVIDILSRAGFQNAQCKKLDTHVWLGRDAEEGAMQSLAIGPLSRALFDVDQATRDKIRDLLKDKLRSYAGANGVELPAACWLVSAAA